MPTAITIIFPSPYTTLLPLIRMGLDTSCILAYSLPPSAIIVFLVFIHFINISFFKGIFSPVMADSSHYRSEPLRRIPSAGTSIPLLISIMSPTSNSD